MKFLYKFGEEMFWTIFWTFGVLIAGFAILNLLSNRAPAPLSSAASWASAHASDQSYP